MENAFPKPGTRRGIVTADPSWITERWSKRLGRESMSIGKRNFCCFYSPVFFLLPTYCPYYLSGALVLLSLSSVLQRLLCISLSWVSLLVPGASCSRFSWDLQVPLVPCFHLGQPFSSTFSLTLWTETKHPLHCIPLNSYKWNSSLNGKEAMDKLKTLWLKEYCILQYPSCFYSHLLREKNCCLYQNGICTFLLFFCFLVFISYQIDR